MDGCSLGGGRTREWAGGSARDDFLFQDSCLVALLFEGGGARDDSMVMSCRRATLARWASCVSYVEPATTNKRNTLQDQIADERVFLCVDCAIRLLIVTSVPIPEKSGIVRNGTKKQIRRKVPLLMKLDFSGNSAKAKKKKNRRKLGPKQHSTFF